MDDTHVEVTAAALSRNFALWQDRAQRGPIVITHHGRARSVLLGIDEYRQRLSHGAAAPIASLFDETDDAMMALGRVGGEWTITALNAAATAMARTTREEALGQPARHLMRELSQADTIRRLDLVWRSGQPAEWRCEGSQSRRPLVMRALRLDDHLGLVICEVAPPGGHGPPHAETRGFLDRLLPATGLAYATLDVGGRFIVVSERFAALAGGSRDAFLDGLRLVDVLVSEEGEQVDELLYQASARIVPIELKLARPMWMAPGKDAPASDARPPEIRRFPASLVALPAETDRQPGYLLLLKYPAAPG